MRWVSLAVIFVVALSSWVNGQDGFPESNACGGKCVANAVCKSDDTDFSCVCATGYRGNGYKSCEDIDECAEGTHNCGENADCHNTEGGYSCHCKPGLICEDLDDGGSFSPSETDFFEVKTEDKFELKGSLEIHIRQNDPADWIDPGWILRCEKREDLSILFPLPLGVRNKIPGEYTVNYTVQDPSGRVVFPVRSRKVIVEDVDECALGTHTCSQFAHCTNTVGGFQCVCMDGYAGDGNTCTKISPCTSGEHLCHEHADCIQDNSLVGFHCACRRGWAGDGKYCADVNECLDSRLHHCPPNSECVNTEGSYRCDCKAGYEKASIAPDICAPAEIPCVDIDECARGLAQCHPHAICINTPGSYNCRCRDGYEGDGRRDCRQIFDMSFSLNGPNPLELNQCDSYSEYGCRLNDRARESATLRINLPPDLQEEIITNTGNFEVHYYLTDAGALGSDHEGHLVRQVRVKPINRCVLPKGHQCRHRCHALAKCKFDPTLSTGYTCECPEGFSPIYNERGDIIDCKDGWPPKLVLKGDNPVRLSSCRVCKRVIATGEDYDESKHGGSLAYDEFPDGSKTDLTPRIKISPVQMINASVSKVTYYVQDDAGNEASAVRYIYYIVEDVHADIQKVVSYVNDALERESQQNKLYLDSIVNTLWSYFVLAMEILVVFAGLILLLIFLPTMVSALSVWWAVNINGKKVPFTDYLEAYMFIFMIIHPFWSKKKRERIAHQNYHRQYHDKVN